MQAGGCLRVKGPQFIQQGLSAFLLGTAILLALEGLKKATKRREQANGALQKGENTT